MLAMLQVATTQTHTAEFLERLWAYLTLGATGIITEEATPLIGGLAAHNRHLRLAAVGMWVAAGTWLAGIGSADVHNRDPRAFPLVTGGAQPAGDGILASTNRASICQLVPWQFDPAKQMNLKRTIRRSSFLLSRLLCNFGAACTSPVLDDAVKPVASGERRWLDGLYLDTPEEWDDPYRFFGW